jgi:hypothetical protein
MWKIQRWAETNGLILSVSGRIEGSQLTQLEQALASEGWRQGVVLDLKDLKLVDRESVLFLARSETGGATLRNCPSYIREWINREKVK